MYTEDERRQRRREAGRRYRERHLEERRESVRRWRRDNRETYLQSNRKSRKKYYDRNREALTAAQRLYWTRNRGRLAPRQRQYTAAHREEARARARAWRLANPEKVAAIQRRRRETGYYRTPARRAKAREWVVANREKVRETLRVSKIRRAAYAGPKLTTAEWRTILDVWEQRCAYCGASGPLEADHRTPLSRGGTGDANNIVPACGRCNRRKHTMTEPEFRLSLVLERQPLDVRYMVDAVPVSSGVAAEFRYRVGRSSGAYHGDTGTNGSTSSRTR